MPERIQLRRIKGWKMPANTVVVTRGPGKKWGNPWIVKQARNGLYHVHGVGGLSEFSASYELGARSVAVDYFRWRTAPTMPVAELRGKNLACFCPLDKPCHADVLLELANQPNNTDACGGAG